MNLKARVGKAGCVAKATQKTKRLERNHDKQHPPIKPQDRTLSSTSHKQMGRMGDQKAGRAHTLRNTWLKALGTNFPNGVEHQATAASCGRSPSWLFSQELSVYTFNHYFFLSLSRFVSFFI